MAFHSDPWNSNGVHGPSNNNVVSARCRPRVVSRQRRAPLPEWRNKLPKDIEVSFEFDQSPYVTRAVAGVLTEGTLGAVLVGLMVGALMITIIAPIYNLISQINPKS